MTKFAFFFILWCPAAGLVGGCGGRAVSRPTPIYFINSCSKKRRSEKRLQHPCPSNVGQLGASPRNKEVGRAHFHHMVRDIRVQHWRWFCQSETYVISFHKLLLKQGDQTKGLQHLGPSIMLVNWVRAPRNKEVGRYIVEHVIRVPHRRFF